MDTTHWTVGRVSRKCHDTAFDRCDAKWTREDVGRSYGVRGDKIGRLTCRMLMLFRRLEIAYVTSSSAMPVKLTAMLTQTVCTISR